MYSASDQAWLRFVLIAALLPTCWLGMQVVHEFGHVLGAWATGATVRRVVLHPLTISRTDLGANPSPLIVVWAGPLLGVLIPLVAWGLAVAVRVGSEPLRFFAGFCLVANGLYIGVGVAMPVGDAREMWRLHPAGWPLALFGITATLLGVLLWNGRARHFGIGPEARPVSAIAAWATVVVLTTLLIVECLWFSRTVGESGFP